ncbi:MAG: CCA tRNA nucleotidyltransferase [Candidatus Omnitrophica bacterium]|nr:CCA tRNA nucleotidyltransferase [Candidatus Omnitrophota bacterium]
MKGILAKVPIELRGLMKYLRDQSLSCGLNTYLVGGFVRDLLLGVRNLDLDIVIEGDAIDFVEKLAALNKSKIIAHKRFGTATVLLSSGLKIDFSTARKETYAKPAHLPVVYAGSLRDDLYRRDFTINAMAVSLNYGEVIDFFSGREDLRHKKIRVLHNLSFRDDPTRILRGIRFEQRLGFRIEASTLKLIKEAVSLGLLGEVHPHRLRDDLILILKEKNAISNIKRIGELSGFEFIHQRLKLNAKTYAYLRSLAKEIRWFNKSYPGRRCLDAWLIYFTGLVDSLKPDAIKGICLRFGLRKGEEKRILSSKGLTKSFARELSSGGIMPSRIFDLLEPLSYETIICLRAKYGNRVLRRNIENFLEIYNGMCVSVSGDDLHCLGLPPGPSYQEIFRQVLSAKLNGDIKTRAGELSLIKKLLTGGMKLKCQDKIR